MRLMPGLRILLPYRLAISSCNTRKASEIEGQAAFWTTGGGSQSGRDRAGRRGAWRRGGEAEKRRKRWRCYASLWREATAWEGGERQRRLEPRSSGGFVSEVDRSEVDRSGVGECGGVGGNGQRLPYLLYLRRKAVTIAVRKRA